MPCPSPRLFFLSHFCLSLSSSFSSPLPLYIFFLQFFYSPPFPPVLCLLYPSSSPPLPLSSFPITLPICDCVPFHSLLLNPLISSVTPPSPPLPDLLLLSSPSSFPSPLTFLRIPSYFPQLAPSAFPVSFPRLVFLLCFSACLYCVSSQQQQQDV